MSSESGKIDEVHLHSTPENPGPESASKGHQLDRPTVSRRKTVKLTTQEASSLISTPPKLTRIPTLVLTPVDADVGIKFFRKSPVSSPTKSDTRLPPPPPLIKMPISTRKDKKSVVPSKTTASTTDTDEDKGEPPKKRARTERNSESGGTPPTRKIIQEIFGTDKSKKAKGKGRKRRRGVGSPKKKTVEQEVEIEEQPKGDPNVLDKLDQEEEEDVENQEIDDSPKYEDPDNAKNSVVTADVNVKPGPSSEINAITLDLESHDEEEKQLDGDDDSESISSVSRRGTRSMAKQIASNNLIQSSQKSKRAQQLISKLPSDVDTNEKVKRGEIHRRRSTSSKSSGSGAQPDSESSGGNDKLLAQLDRERDNPTPFSMVSEDDDQHKDEGDEHLDTVSISDIQDQKDSDVDSTYSWKPVRAAAVLAMEQVTKKHGASGGSDTDVKTAAAAERRARKILRYKGRNRRTLLFKSSHAKKLANTKNRYSAQPTVLSHVFHNGVFQKGDVVNVELDDGKPIYGQITGILMDAYGAVSAGIRWLAPLSPIYGTIHFDPGNYAFRYDIPEKLIKIEFVNFVMHLNEDFFHGNNDSGKIDKNGIYTRIGKPLYAFEFPSDTQSSSIGDSSDEDEDTCTNSANKEAEHCDNKINDEQGNDTDSTGSTDIEEIEEESLPDLNEKLQNDSETVIESVSVEN